jgi:hypothetical protein
MSEEEHITRYKSPFGQYLDAVVSPTAAFGALGEKPRWLVFFLITIAVSLVVLHFLMPYSIEAQRETLNQIIEESREVMPPEQLARLEEYREGVGTGFTGRVLPYLVMPVSLFIYLLIASAGLNIGVGVTGERLGFRNAVSVVSLASVTMAVGSVVTLVLVLVKGDVYVGANLGLLFPRLPTEWYTRLLKGFASQIGVFSAWNVFLLTLGVRGVTDLSMRRSFTVVLVLWFLWAVLMAVLNYLGFAFG